MRLAQAAENGDRGDRLQHGHGGQRGHKHDDVVRGHFGVRARAGARARTDAARVSLVEQVYGARRAKERGGRRTVTIDKDTQKDGAASEVRGELVRLCPIQVLVLVGCLRILEAQPTHVYDPKSRAAGREKLTIDRRLSQVRLGAAFAAASPAENSCWWCNE